MQESIFISNSKGTVTVGFGPFDRRAEFLPGRDAFFVSDFFLKDRTPWWYPHQVEHLPLSTFLDRCSCGNEPHPAPLLWSPPSEGDFKANFTAALEYIRTGVLQKAVAVTAETAIVHRSFPLSAVIKKAIETLDATQSLYGYFTPTDGMIGVTPEILFTQESPTEFRTVALAGTSTSSGELRLSAKDKHEHALVVTDILERSERLGSLWVGETEPWEIGSLVHLRTPLKLSTKSPNPYPELIQRLHPTAAMGTYPRSDAGKLFLLEQETRSPRGKHGAPFGFFSARTAQLTRCVVAIRNIQWNETMVRLVAGAGIVSQSLLASEWKECELKRRATKQALCP